MRLDVVSNLPHEVSRIYRIVLAEDKALRLEVLLGDKDHRQRIVVLGYHLEDVKRVFLLGDGFVPI